MSSSYDHRGCPTSKVQVTRTRLTRPGAEPVDYEYQPGQFVKRVNETDDLFEGKAKVMKLDHSYHHVSDRYLLEICDGKYSDGSARHKQVTMEGARVAVRTGSTTTIDGFVQGTDGGLDSMNDAAFYKETWYLS